MEIRGDTRKGEDLLQASETGKPNYLALAFMIVGATLGSLSQTAMNTMLPSVTAEFGVSVASGQWLVTIFPLCLGITMPIVAFLSCRFATRRLYLGSMALFILGAALMLMVDSFPLLILGRVLQGCAVGVMLPLLQVVALSQVPVQRRGTVMGFIGLALGFAPSVGPTIGGALESAFGWRSFFVFLIVLAAFIFAICFCLVKKQPPVGGDKRRLDTLSLMLSTVGFGGILLGVSNASQSGLASISFALPVTLGLIVLAVFAYRQLHICNPLLDLHVFAYREMLIGTIGICMLFFAFIGVTLVITLELQNLHGQSSLYAGMVLLPTVITALLANPISGMVLDRFGPRPICIFGAVTATLGTFLMLPLSSMDSLVLVACLQMLRSLGISSLIMPLTTWSLSGLPAHLMPDGTSVSNALRQIAAAFGTSCMILLMAGGAVDGSVTAAGVDAAMLLSLVMVAILTVLVLVFVKRKMAS